MSMWYKTTHNVKYFYSFSWAAQVRSFWRKFLLLTLFCSVHIYVQNLTLVSPVVEVILLSPLWRVLSLDLKKFAVWGTMLQAVSVKISYHQRLEQSM